MEPDRQPHLDDSAEALLEAWRADQVKARRREAKAVDKAIRWLTSIATTKREPDPFEQEMPIGGHGCPPIPETAVAEFAAVAGMTTHGARAYLSDVWDLQWRFPRTHAALREGRIELWRARNVTSILRSTRFEAAQYIDQRIAPIIDTIGLPRLRQMLALAEILSDPDAAVARGRAAAEHRSIEIHPSPTTDGLMDVFGRLDYTDAHDLEAALQMVAAELGNVPDGEEPEALNIRRAKALGMIARRQLAGQAGEAGPGVETRVLHTYLHLHPDSPTARIEQGNTLAPVERVAAWCRTGGTKVIIRPVLDLAACLSRDGYTPTELMREQAILINQTCVHPYCTRPARDCDLDHTQAYQDPDEGGPPGQTNSHNLAPLCRFHHRLKTHTGWTYTHLEPGYYLWRSPHGRHYLRTPAGTIRLDAAAP